MKHLAICFCADKNYYEPLLVAVTALLENNRNIKMTIYLISDDIVGSELAYLSNLVENYQQKFVLIAQVETIFSKLKTTTQFTKAIYYRLSIPYVIPESVVLYLDCDIVVNGSLEKLTEIKLDEHIIGAVEDIGYIDIQRLGLPKNTKYFNSGVLLINTDNWKKHNITQQAVDYILANEKIILYPDQDALNVTIEDKCYYLNPTFNQQANFFYKETQENGFKIFGKNFEYAKKSPVIIHYSGSKKPWHTSGTHPFKNLYWFYLAKTELFHEQYSDFSIKNYLTYLIKKIKRINY